MVLQTIFFRRNLSCLLVYLFTRLLNPYSITIFSTSASSCMKSVALSWNFSGLSVVRQCSVLPVEHAAAIFGCRPRYSARLLATYSPCVTMRTPVGMYFTILFISSG